MAPPRIFARVTALLLAIAGARIAVAQETIHFSFDSLPIGTPLAEQFAGQGVHFVQGGRYDLAFVASSRDVGGAPVRNVGLFNRSAHVGILFDKPVQSFSAMVAVDPIGDAGSLAWTANGLDYPTTANYWDIKVPVSTLRWVQTGTFTTTSSKVRLLELGSENIIGGFNNNAAFYFTDFTVTLIPEPSTTALCIIGAAASLIQIVRRRSNPA